ncbi:MAG: AEC family transporter [Gammaproteobacteria bacterium]|nr:AEC family transporter [Gammaproteobacteria bacterium]
MLQVLGLVLPLFGIILLGYLSGKAKAISIDGLDWMNFFIIYIALPPLIFLLLFDTPFEEFGNSRFLFATTFATFIIFSIGFCVAKYLARDSMGNSTIQGFVGAYGNIGYLAPPLALAAFGPEAAVPVALIFCLDNTMHFIMAPTLMALGGREKVSRWSITTRIVKNIVSHPFIIATTAGMTAAFYELKLVEPAQRLLEILAQAAAPCALFAMGITVALRPLTRIPPQLTYLLPLKLLVHPLLVYLLVSPIPDLPAVWLHSAVLLAALPTAANVFVIGQQYGFWQERASSAIVISTVLSTLTVTAYLYLVKIGTI